MQHGETLPSSRSGIARAPFLALVGASALAVSLAVLPDQATAAAHNSNLGLDADPSGGISVNGTGSAVIVPDLATIEFNVRSQAKSMLQAMQEFKGKRALFEKAMMDFDEEGVTLEPGGISIGLRSSRNQNFVINGEAPPSAPYEARERILVQVPMPEGGTETLDLLAEIIAAADDVDVRLDGPDPNRYYSSQEQEPSAIHFSPSAEAMEAARDAALAAAYADAVKQAEKLAQLAGGRVGPAQELKLTKGLPDQVKASGAAENSVTLAIRFDLVR